MFKREQHWLDTGDRFPDLKMETIDEQSLDLPGFFSGGYGVLLVYRGHW